MKLPDSTTHATTRTPYKPNIIEKEDNRWNELKEHAKRQLLKVDRDGRIGKIVTHVWKDVLNKMWSIENKNKND